MLVLYEGEDVREFANQVKTIVEKLTAKGLKLKPAKCKVGYLKMRILGHLCEKGAARIDPVKVECFSKMERLKSLQAVQLILRFLNYVRDYRCVTIWGGGSVVPGGGGEEKVYWFWSKGIAKRAEELPSPKEGVTCDAVWVEEVGGNVATSGVHG